MCRNTDLSPADVEAFNTLRPKLTGLAYRILGSLSDAEDAVQDTFLRWARSDRDAIENRTGWLITACTRRCLDMRRTGDRARVDYVGAWLPEPVQIATEAGAEAQVELASSLSTAFLLVLERLTPKERAAFLLHDVFDLPHADIAETLDISEAGSRKLVSRARGNVTRSRTRHTPPPEQQDAFLSAFHLAVTEGRVDELSQLLAKDARLSADGGGKVAAIRETIEGQERLCTFVSRELHRYWAGHDWVPLDLNGTRGVLISLEGKATAAVTFAYDECDRVQDIFIVRNPDKLAHLGATQIH